MHTYTHEHIHTHTHIERDFPYDASLPQWSQGLVLAQAKVRQEAGASVSPAWIAQAKQFVSSVTFSKTLSRAELEIG